MQRKGMSGSLQLLLCRSSSAGLVSFNSRCAGGAGCTAQPLLMYNLSSRKAPGDGGLHSQLQHFKG